MSGESGGISGGAPRQRGPEKFSRLAVDHMEQAFRRWEDLGLAKHILSRVQINDAPPAVGQVLAMSPLRNFGLAREYLAKASNPKNSIAGLENFLITDEERAIEMAYSRRIMRDRGLKNVGNSSTLLSDYDNHYIPQMVAWARDSRRIFSLNRETVELFKNISYDTFTFSDDKLLHPFKSYAISFENSPLMTTTESGRHVRVDALMITDLSSLDPSISDSLLVRVFYSDPERAVGSEPLLTTTERKILENEAQKTGPVSEEAMEIIGRQLGGATLKLNTSDPFRIDLGAPVVDPELPDSTNSFRKVIAGLCLYIAHAPKKEFGMEDIRGETWHPLGKKSGKGKKITPQSLISDEAQIFSVRNIHEFDPKAGKVKYTDVKGVEYDAHTVRAHDKRPKGMGHIPDAPYSVRIQSYWRSLKNLSEEALPPGSTTVVK